MELGNMGLRNAEGRGEMMMVNGEQDTAVPAIVDDRLMAVADAAEKRIASLNKIKRLALRLTNRNDWVDQGGRPYLQVSGSEKVARLFGISWRIEEPVMEREEGGHFSYAYKGEFSLAGASIEAIGARSSRNGFFRKYGYEGEGEDRKRVELPPSEIDRTDVRKSAFTNCVGNGVTRLLGLRNLTWDDLKECAGITREMVANVEYRKAGEKKWGFSRVSTGPSDRPPSDVPATANQLNAIRQMMRTLGIRDDLSQCETAASLLNLPDVLPELGRLRMPQASELIKALGGELDRQKREKGSESREDVHD